MHISGDRRSAAPEKGSVIRVVRCEETQKARLRERETDFGTGLFGGRAVCLFEEFYRAAADVVEGAAYL